MNPTKKPIPNRKKSKCTKADLLNYTLVQKEVHGVMFPVKVYPYYGPIETAEENSLKEKYKNYLSKKEVDEVLRMWYSFNTKEEGEEGTET